MSDIDTNSSGVEPVLLYTHYRPAEINNAYWASTKKLVAPGILVRVFLATALVTTFWIVNSGADHINNVGAALGGMQHFVVIVSPVVIPVAATLLAYLLMRMRCLTSYDRRPNLHAPLSFLVQKSGLELQSQTGRGVMSWQEFAVAFETGESFIVGADADEMFVLPKRCFSSVAEIERVRAILRSENKAFKPLGKQVADGRIVFEKRAVQAILIDGVEYFFPVADGAENLATGKTAPEITSSDTSDKDSAAPDAVAPTLPTHDVVAPVEAAADLDLRPKLEVTKDALEIDVIYQPEELKRAEKIYFFRKRLPAFAIVYTKRAILLALWALFVETIRDHSEVHESILALAAPLFWLFIPAAIIHAAIAYRAASREISQDTFLARTFAFRLAESFFGLTVGDKYSVLAWSNFLECWESEESFILIFGRQGRAMWVLPKRAMNRMQLAYVGNLLKSNIKAYKLLY